MPSSSSSRPLLCQLRRSPRRARAVKGRKDIEEHAEISPLVLYWRLLCLSAPPRLFQPSQVQALYESHQWFALRDATEHSKAQTDSEAKRLGLAVHTFPFLDGPKIVQAAADGFGDRLTRWASTGANSAFGADLFH